MTDDYLNLVGDIMYPKCTYENTNEEQKVNLFLFIIIYLKF